MATANRNLRQTMLQTAMHESETTGYKRVDTNISCMLTRFRVRTIYNLLKLYFHYRRIRKSADNIEGLLHMSFLVEDRHTCFTLSFWRDAEAIGEFNLKIREHIDAANSCPRLLHWAKSGPELWSAQFRLSAISPHNMRWSGFNLDEHLNHRT